MRIQAPFDLLFGPAINPHQLRLDTLNDKPKSAKEAHEWLVEQQDLHQRILERDRAAGTIRS